MSALKNIKVGNTLYNLSAATLSSDATIDGVAFNGGDSAVHYGTCATAAATAAKLVSLGNDITLDTGARVTVKFTYANTAANPTLSVNGSTAKAIMAYGTTAAGSGSWSAGETVSFEYDGTYWQMVNGGIASTSNYGRVKLDAAPTNGSMNAPTSDGVYGALALKAPLASPALTGTPTAPTQNADDNSTKIATTAHVKAAIHADDTVLNAYPTETASGAVASTSVGADNIPVKSLVAQITPVQNLHGYANPWPAGGGKNLFDPATVVSGELSSTGGITTNANAKVSDYIPVTASTEYYLSQIASTSTVNYSWAEYGSSKNFISAGAVTGTNIKRLTTGATTAFLRITLMNTQLDSCMVCLYSAGTDFAPYSNICPISGWSAVSISHTGKNLFDAESCTEGYYIAADGTLTASAGFMYSAMICVKPGNYHFHATNGSATSNTRIHAYDKEGTWMSQLTAINAPGGAVIDGTFSVPAGVSYVRVSVVSDISNAQLEAGNSVTAFAPFAGGTESISLGQTVYGGNINNVTTGLLTITHELINLGTLTWTDNATPLSASTEIQSIIAAPASASDVADILCDSYATAARSALADKQISIAANGAIVISDTRFNGKTAAEIAAILSGVFMYYPLKTPIPVQLSQTTEVTSLLGDNNVFADSGDVAVTFRCDPDLFAAMEEARTDAIAATKADKDGTYPDLTAGIAQHLISSVGQSNSAPYLYRAIPAGAGNMEQLRGITGATMAHNQILANGNFDSVWSTQNASMSVSGNIGTFTASQQYGQIKNEISGIKSGHKYLLSWKIKTETPTSSVLVSIYEGGAYHNQNTASSYGWQLFSMLVELNSSTATVMVRDDRASGWDSIYVAAFCLTDLTAYFGSSSIADHAYTLEQGTAGAGIAWLKSYGFFTEDYYAYDAGSLQSVKVSAHKTYDADNNLLGNYPLDSTKEWRGVYKLDSANNIVADGDLYPPSGQGTRKYKKVDLGSLNWDYISSYNGWYCEPGDMANASKMVCDTYPYVGAYSNLTDKAIAFIFSNNIIIRDSAFDGMTGAQVKSALSGKYVVYALVTPTSETADSYQLNQSIAAGGAEELVDAAVAAGTRDVAVPPGTDSFYPLDANEVLDAPTTDGTYNLRVTVSGGVPTYSWVSV